MRLIHAKTRWSQRGFSLLIIATITILGFAWFAASALAKLTRGAPERDVITGVALQQAKKAVLAYVAQQAFNTSELYPGRLPCPEPTSVAGSTTVVAGTGNAVYDGKTFDQAYAGFAAPFDTT